MNARPRTPYTRVAGDTHAAPTASNGSAGAGSTSARAYPPTLRSFAAPNYRLFFAGALVSNTGTWMSRVAQDWLVLVELTDHSATALGAVTGVQFAPALLLAPWAGALADRLPKRRLLALTQTTMLITSLLQAALVISGAVQLWHVFALAGLQGVASALDAPARQAFVSELVGTELLSNAIGLNSASFNGARMIGPGIAGVMIAAWGTGWVFVANAVSFLAILLALWRMNPEGLDPAPTATGRGRVVEGLRYLRGRPDLLLILWVVFLFATFGLNFQMTTALMATLAFAKGPQEYGLLGSMMAIGAFTGALLTARRAAPRLRTVVLALLGFAVTSAAAALAPTYEWFAVLLILVGLSSLTVLPTANSLIQTSVDPAMRGRVMAVYLAIFFGGTPLGAPLIGWVGQAWGPRWTILVGSLAALLAAVNASMVVMRRDSIRLRGSWRPPRLYVDRPARATGGAVPAEVRTEALR